MLKFAGNTKVFKQKMQIAMPSFCIALRNNDADFSMMTEIVFWNYTLEINRFLDRRNDLMLKAHSI